MNKVIWKDNIKEIFKTWPRFLSIFLISLLGVAFFVGIKATSPSMIKTSQEFFARYDYPHGKVQSTYGVDQEDMAILEQAGLRVQGLKTLDATLQPQSERVTVYPFDDQAYFFLTRGDFPKGKNQIALDMRFDNGDIQIGDKITLESSQEDLDLDAENVPAHLKETEFTLVGFVDSSLYFSKISRGMPGISGFVLVDQDAIGGTIYSQALYWLKDQTDLLAYSPQYDQAITPVVDNLENLFENRAQERLASLKADGQAKIDDGAKEIKEGYEELDKAQADLDEAKAELIKGQADYQSGLKDLEDAKKTLVEDQAQLQQGQIDVQAGWDRLASERECVNQEEANYQAGVAEYIEGQARFDREMALGQEELDQGWQSLADAKAQLDQSANELAEGQAQLAAGQSELSNQRQAMLDQFATSIPDWSQQLNQMVEAAKDPDQTIDQEAAILANQGDQARLTLIYLQNQLKALDEQETQLNQGMAQAQAGLDQALAGQAVLAQEKTDLSDKASQVQAGLDQIQSQKQALQEQAGQVQAGLQAAVDQVAALEGALAQAQANLVSITDPEDPALAQAQAAVEQAQAGYQEAQANYQALSSQADQVSQGLQALEGEAASLTQNQADLADGLAQIDTEASNLAVTIQELEDQLARRPQLQGQIDQARQSLQTQIDQLQAGLQAMDQAQAQLGAASLEISQGQAQYDKGLAQYQTGLADYEAGLAQYQAGQASGQASLQAALDKLNQGRSLLDGAWQQLYQGQIDLESAQGQIDQERAKVEDGQAQIDQATAELEDAKKELEEGQKDYEEGLASFQKEKEEALADLTQAQVDLNEAQAQLDDLDLPLYYVTDRSGFDAYDTLYDNANQISQISQVFPLFFFAIAILVTFTTIKRMVSEQRNYLGTLKQMGYGNLPVLSKFVTYAGLAALLGIGLGIPLGYWVFPPVIMNAYNNLFHFDQAVVVQSASLNLTVALITLACALIPAIWTPLSMLRTQPARLLLPEPPKAGKKILLERLPFIWERLSFNRKMTIRNLLRYKGRNAMTLIGVAGCTMLIVTGFGISDTISDFVNIQFGQIQAYDAIIQLVDYVAADDIDQIIALDGLAETLQVQQTSWQTDLDHAANQGVTVLVPQGPIDGFLKLTERGSDQAVDWQKGAYITERLAEYAKVSPGQTLQLQDEGKVVEIPVAGIVENYIGHYLYLGPDLYAQFFNDQSATNALLTYYDQEANRQAVDQILSDHEKVQAVMAIESIEENVNETMGSLNLITVVLVVSAATLAFIVLYNLTNINVSERLRELSTIKVLGFYNREVSFYIFDEIMILTSLGAILGMILGTFLNTYILKTIQMPDLFFYPNVKWLSYLISFALTFVFASIVMVFMHQKIAKIDMVEALKAIE